MPRRIESVQKKAARRPRKPQAPLRELPPAVPDWGWERRVRAEGWLHVAGVDEAGRGPLAGPVVAAAVILPEGLQLEALRDSKCLPAPVRETLYAEITARALCWSVAAADVEEIDTFNILRATHLAMARALEGLSLPPHGALVDGLPVKGLACPHQAIVDGDARCVSIAAASILAKVTRDRMMVGLDERHPGYGFARHKGYSTPEHLRALRELGPSPCHRRSFRPVADMLAVTEEALALELVLE
jgi:ribonuclease HII